MSETAALGRAEMLASLERWDEAAKAATSVLATEPSSGPALNLLARCMIGLDRFAEAADAARRAAALDPMDDQPLRMLSIAASSLGRHDEALAAANAAVTLDPEQAANHVVAANALVDAGRHAEARPAAWHAVQLAPHDPDTHNMLGIALAGSGDPVGARSAYQEALRLDPGHALAMNNLAALDMDRNRLGSAARGIASGLRADPQEAVLRGNLDLIGERLVHRLLNAMLLSGFLLLIVLGAESAGAVPAYWPRALVGLALIAAYAGVVWATLRHLPPGMRRHLRSLPRRTSSPFRWIVVAVVSVALLVTAFAPGDVAALGGLLFVVVIRGAQLFLVFLAARWLIRRIRGR